MGLKSEAFTREGATTVSAEKAGHAARHEPVQVLAPAVSLVKT
jgi:hypothetical protein